MSIGRRIAFVLAAGFVALSAPAAALACEPYTYQEADDWFRLADGVRWAFVADVVDEVQNPDTPGRPEAVVLEVRETIAGDISQTRLRIEQDPGCDGFWYGKGDRIVAAIGHQPGLAPPFAGITDYHVAVWVIRDGAVDATIRAPWVGGRRPETERELRALLETLPDTDTVDLPARPPASPVLTFAAVAGILAAILTVRGIGRIRP